LLYRFGTPGVFPVHLLPYIIGHAPNECVSVISGGIHLCNIFSADLKELSCPPHKAVSAIMSRIILKGGSVIPTQSSSGIISARHPGAASLPP
jgi:hypothetical protein